MAGDEAIAAQAYEEAAGWYERALETGTAHLSEAAQLRLRVEAADARRLAGLDGHAEDLLRAAEETLVAGDDELRRRTVLAALQLGGGVEPGPAQRRAAALAERVLAAETDTAWWARIAAAASLVHSISGTAATCRDLFLTAWRRAPDDEVLAGVLPYAYMALAHPDDLRDRERAAARLTEAARRLEDPVAAFEAAHLTFSVALQRADGAAARRAHRAMLGLTDRVGDAGRRWSLAYAEAALASLDGRLEEAEALAGVALEIGSGVAPQRAMGAYAGGPDPEAGGRAAGGTGMGRGRRARLRAGRSGPQPGDGRLRRAQQVHAEPPGQRDDERQREAHDVGVRPFDALHQRTARTLDAVRTGLVERLAGADVPVEFGIGEAAEPDAGAGQRRLDVVAAPDCDAGQNPVRPAGEASEHGAGVGGIGGLAEDHLVVHHGGVPADHELVRGRGHRARLGRGEPAHVDLRRLHAPGALVHVGRAHVDLQAEPLQQLASTRGGGGEDDAGAVSHR